MDAETQAAILAWKCNRRLQPCRVSGYACPFIIEGSDVIQTKKCRDITARDWLKIITEQDENPPVPQ